MIRRLVIRLVGLAAILIASGCFWYLRRNFDRFADRYCGYNEARGNCEAFHAWAVDPATSIFIAAMVVLAAVILLANSRRSGADD